MKKINNSISVVVPVYNAEKSLVELISNLKCTLAKFDEYEIIFIDDYSCDNSYNVLNKTAIGDNSITAVKLGENVGQQHATMLGLKRAKYNYIVIMDDDLSHKTEDIIKLYDKAIKGFDVVYGINSLPLKLSTIRAIGSKLRDITFNFLTKKPKNIKVSSFRIMNRQIVDKVTLANTKFVYLSMEILKNTAKISNVYVEYKKGGPTNYSFKKLVRLMMGIYIYYSSIKILKVFRKRFQGYNVISITQGGKKI